MKKLSLYIFLFLMFCNVGFADEKIYWCQWELAEEGELIGIPVLINPEKDKIVFLQKHKLKDGREVHSVHPDGMEHFFKITEKNSNFYKAHTPVWNEYDNRRVDLTFDRETNELSYKFEDLTIISRFFCNSDL